MTQTSDLSDMFTDEILMVLVMRREVEVEVDMPTVLISIRQSDREV